MSLKKKNRKTMHINAANRFRRRRGPRQVSIVTSWKVSGWLNGGWRGLAEDGNWAGAASTKFGDADPLYHKRPRAIITRRFRIGDRLIW